MAMHVPAPSVRPTRQHRYLRAPEPVYFPVREKVPETNENLERRLALYQSLKLEVAATATIGSDQFVYWDPTTAKKCLAPDVFVRLGTPHQPFRAWKVWERGAPDLGVEIVSAADESEPDWTEKLARYRAAGVSEVVRFDAEDAERPLRVWDTLSGDLVERSPEDPYLSRCETLGLWWVIVRHEAIGPMFRLARDREGRELLPTPDEQAAKARESEAKARESEAKARESEAKAREENQRLQAEMAALRAELGSARAKPRKRRI